MCMFLHAYKINMQVQPNVLLSWYFLASRVNFLIHFGYWVRVLSVQFLAPFNYCSWGTSVHGFNWLSLPTNFNPHELIYKHLFYIYQTYPDYTTNKMTSPRTTKNMATPEHWSPLIKMILQYGTNALGTALKLVLCLQFSFFFFRFFFITVILISKNIWYM